MSSERSSTGAPGRLHLDGRFLEYERGKRQGKDDAEEEMPCDILRAMIFFGIG